MSQTIQFRRGTDAERATIVFNQGEPVWTTDTKILYIGDGSTLGGNVVSNSLFVGNENFTAVVPTSGDSAITNGSGLHLALYDYAKNATPFGSGLSEHNRYSILLFPGEYNLMAQASVNLTPRPFVDIYGVGDKDAIVIKTQSPYLETGYCSIKNITLKQVSSFYVSNAANATVSDVVIDNIQIECSGNVALCRAFSNYGAPISRFKILNSTFSGGMFFGDPSYGAENYNTTNSVIDGCKIYSYASFYALAPSSTASNRNNMITNCFIDGNTTMFGASELYGYHWDSTNLFQNCWIKCASIGETSADATTVFQGHLKDCYIDGYFAAFQGKMTNCIVNATGYNAQPMNLFHEVDITTYPVICDSTFIARSTLNQSITGLFGISGLFSHCRFNKPVATGVTGRFGNQFNIVHGSIK